MSKVLNIVLGSVASIVLFMGATSSASAATAATKCTVEAAKLGSWSKAFTISKDTATVKFKVNGTNCTTPVTLASWERPTLEGINDQKLYKYTTATFGPGEHTLSVPVPACYFQADLIEGANATAADGTANYQYQNGKFVDGGLRDFIKAGNTECKVVVVPPKPVEPPVVVPTPTPQPVTPAVVTTTEVKSLPSTGSDAASVVAGTMGLSTSTGLAYNLFRKRKFIQ